MAARTQSGVTIIDANVADITSAIEAQDDQMRLGIVYIGDGKVLVTETSADT